MSPATLETVEAHARQLLSALDLWPSVISYSCERDILDPNAFAVKLQVEPKRFSELASRDGFVVKRRFDRSVVLCCAYGEYGGAAWQVRTGYNPQSEPDLRGVVLVESTCRTCGKTHEEAP